MLVRVVLYSILPILYFIVQIRESIFSGFSLGTVTGSAIFVFNNNIVGDLGNLNITGTFLKIGVATNYWLPTSNFTQLINFTSVTADTVKVIDNDFVVPVGKTGVKVTNVNITNQGGGSIISNTFSGGGTYLDGIQDDTLNWIVEANGKDVLATSARRFVRKIRNEAQIVAFLSQPDASDYIYEIDGIITATQSWNIPAGGITFNGYGANFSTITTATPNLTIFTGSGNIFINSMKLSNPATGSKVFNMTAATGFEACEFTNVNFENNFDIGSFSGYRQGLLLNGFMFNTLQGILFKGTWTGGFRVDASRFIMQAGSSYMFKGDVGQTFGSRFVSNANSTIPSGCIGYSFTAANFVNDASFQLIGAQFNGAGTYVSSITRTSIKSLWRDCVGVQDTFPGAILKSSGDSITVLSNGVFSELNVPIVIDETAWFQSNNANAFHLQYLSTLPLDIKTELVIACQAGNNNELEIQVRKYNTTNTTFTVIDNIKMTSNGGGLGTRVEPATLPAYTSIVKDERIRVFIRNNSGNTNVLTEASSKLIISKRS